MTTGLFIGRFQPFHKGHLDALRQILREVDFVKIAIGSSNKKRTEENPLSYQERKNYIRSVLPFENYAIYPSPDTPNDRVWLKKLQRQVGHFDTVFVTKNLWTESIFKEYGIPMKKTKMRLPINGTSLRAFIRKKKSYKNNLVKPLPKTLQYIIENIGK